MSACSVLCPLQLCARGEGIPPGNGETPSLLSEVSWASVEHRQENQQFPCRMPVTVRRNEGSMQVGRADT